MGLIAKPGQTGKTGATLQRVQRAQQGIQRFGACISRNRGLRG